MISAGEIKNLLAKYETRPSKLMGQNFLIDQATLDKIIQAAQLNASDIVLEIGPGIGTLTQELAKKAKNVIAIEKDREMLEILKETLQNYQNVKLIEGNALTIPYPLDAKPYKVVANIPYYLTSPLIRKFLEKGHRPDSMILMVQKEVAQRICAKPGDMSILAVSVQFYAKPEIISYVKKEHFWPSPKVDSAIIKITPKASIGKKIDADVFFNIVKAGFSHPRKQLLNNLSTSLKIDREKASDWLSKNNISPLQRAQTLSIEDWVKLVDSFR